MNRTLLVTQWCFPLRVIRWEDAVTMLYVGKAEALLSYDHQVRSPSTAMSVPSVIRLRRGIDKKALPLSAPLIDRAAAPAEWQAFLVSSV